MVKSESEVVGLLLVGSCGLTASAVIAGVAAMKLGVVPKSYGVTGNRVFATAGLPGIERIEVGGWDFFERSIL